MSELKINEDEIKRVTDEAKFIVKAIVSDIMEATNKDNDIFLRYMSYVRLRPVFYMHDFLRTCIRDSMAHGFGVKDEILQTPAAKENGWVGYTAQNSAFFMNESSEDSEEDKKSNVDFKFEKLMEEVFGDIFETVEVSKH